MECKKCKKECFENELNNGICQECNSKNKSYTIKTVIISITLSVLITLMIIALSNNEVSLSDFKVDTFNLDTEKTTYKYSEDSVSYSGKGTISCKNKNNDYIILVERKDKANNEIDYITIVVHNGLGELSTYDSNYSGTIKKPEYEFNIIGYRSFKK